MKNHSNPVRGKQGEVSLLLRCMDYRLGKAIEERMQPYRGRMDVISIAGSCRVLAQTPDSWPALFIFDNIHLAYEHHRVREVILTQHQDCGAYGGSEVFASPEAEKTTLVNDLRAVQELLLKRYPELKVSLFWIKRAEEEWEFETVNR